MRHLKYLLLITASFALSACGSNSDSGGGVPGAFSIKLNGGQGFNNISSQGGNGGVLDTTGMVGDLKFHATGAVDASFTVPTVTPNFGTNPATISSNTSVTFKNFTGHTFPVSGSLFTTEDHNLYTSTGTVGTLVTGLTVNPGVTLTFVPNDALNGGINTIIILPDAAIINGTVKITNDGQGFTLGASFLQIGTTGTVTTAASGAGHNGGALALVSDGYLISQGTIDSSGKANGGAAGTVNLGTRSSFLYNTGTVTALGADSASGAGGAGGSITLSSSTASVFTSGAISCSGGKATALAGNGGDAGAISVITGGIGKTVVGGTLTASGGNAASGNGGAAGTHQLVSASDALIVNATLSFNGGNGAGAAAVGGAGGIVQLKNNVGVAILGDNAASPQGMKVSGNIALNGGTATGSSGLIRGGNGGQLLVTSAASPAALPGTGTVEFFGYTGITLNGGAGATGGLGGTMMAFVNAATVANINLPAGAITNKVPITARGGDGSLTGNHSGGFGGTIKFATPASGGAAATTTTTNSGPLDVSGGAGDIGGGAGQVLVYSFGTMTNTGAITGKGGNGATRGGAGAVQVLFGGNSDGVNSGVINVSGGTGGTGGTGGGATWSTGGHITNSAAIIASGGNGTTTGGNGGSIGLLSQTAPTTTGTGALNVAKGTGGTTALNGLILIDGTDVTTASGIF